MLHIRERNPTRIIERMITSKFGGIQVFQAIEATKLSEGHVMPAQSVRGDSIHCMEILSTNICHISILKGKVSINTMHSSIDRSTEAHTNKRTIGDMRIFSKKSTLIAHHSCGSFAFASIYGGQCHMEI